MPKTHLTYPEARAQLDAIARGALVRDASKELRLTLMISESPRLALAALDLSEFADERADVGGPTVQLDASRSFHQEIAEELADARNYLVWWFRTLPAGSPERATVKAVLRSVVKAYADLTLGLL